MTPSKDTEQDAPKNARYLWYVTAYKGHTEVNMPCWEGEDEAHRTVDTLAGYGWVGPIINKDKATGKVTRAEKPRAHQVVVARSHAHWREFLPSVDAAERAQQISGGIA